MKARRFIFVFLALFLMPAAARADFYVIPTGGSAAGTQIASLPYTISSAGLYYIKQNLTCPAGSSGITVNADDVTLDLMGFSLIGTGSATNSGVYMSNRKNVEIRNGNVRGFGYRGIYAEGSSNMGHRVINVRVHDNGGAGIYLSGKSNLVKDCTSFSNGSIGIYVQYGSIVLNCANYNNAGDGISMYIGSSAIGNTSHDNGGDGIEGSDGVSVASNNCYSNTGRGIYTLGNSLVKGNVCYQNGNFGIKAGVNCLIAQNASKSNSGGNISSGEGCVLVDNIMP